MKRTMKKLVLVTSVGALLGSSAVQAWGNKTAKNSVKKEKNTKTGSKASAGHGIRTAKSEAEMNNIIKEGRPTIVIITTTWCEACKQTDPQFKQVAKELNDKITFVTVDGDKVRIPGINAYPTIKAYDKGKPAVLYTDKGKKGNQLPWTSETVDLRKEISRLIK